MLTLWKTLIQPLLDYCSQLWSLHKSGDIQQLEMVQRSFTRQIRGMRDLSYIGIDSWNWGSTRSNKEETVENFKSGLGKFLWTVPNQPPVLGYTARCWTSNNIPHQLALRDKDARIGSSNGPPRL
ncbi:hypothetical protein Pcinc_004002 [Petrolisthes cinctipes]|uniref:Uncharacterized protein n=1 Tax=Petrolisthes cinctipes TaxID=88211 RepID=A0AAE1GHJ0_PETCI|nr:hypothetical protein Pcinc_004002 [Petrolisthes cinctipes]